MKTKLLIEASPDEIRAVLDFLDGKPTVVGTTGPQRAQTPAGFPIEVEMVVASRGGPNRDVGRVRTFLEAVVKHTVNVKRPSGAQDVTLFSLQVGTKQSSDDGFNDYVRIHMAGVAPALGYIWPSNGLLNLRLPADVLTGQVHAQPREAKDSDTFGVQTRLTSQAAVDEAIGLLNDLVTQYLGGTAT